MRFTGWLRVLSCALMLGCGAGDGSSDGIRGAGLPSAGRTPTNGTTTTPTMSGSAGMGGFGNTGTMVNSTPTPAKQPQDTCTDGMRCFDSNEADKADCGHQTLSSSVKTIDKPGNALLVFDTSGSMNDNWDGGGQSNGQNGNAKWQVSGSAIINALMPLQDLLTVGTVFFPRSDPNAPTMCVDPTGIACAFVPGLQRPSGTCGVTPISSADQINFMPGAQFLTTFAGPGGNAAPPYAPVPGGRTPLKEGLQQAQAAIASSALTGITTVIVITDGDPNCNWDEGVSTQIVTDWNTAGIKTYVLGAPGVGSMGEQILNDLAAAGGTGTYIPPTDPQALQDKLREIVSSTVTSGIDTCTIDLNPPAEVPDKLHLVVTENGAEKDVPRNLSKDATWSVTKDGATVTLEGQLCDLAKAGTYSQLRFDFGCVMLPPPDPPPVPE